MLEQKVQELLEVSTEVLASQEAAKSLKDNFNAALEVLPGASELVSVFEQKAKELETKSISDNNKGSMLKKEILGLMTEKTHMFDCATITKRITKGLKVHNPLSLFQELKKINLTKLVTLGFKKADVVKAIELGALVLPAKGEVQFVEVTEIESLAVKKK